MLQRLLDSDWLEYDNKKKKSIDGHFFACTEPWEVQYLIEKIKKFFPEYSDMNIARAITTCCLSLNTPHPRKEFIQCVIQRLINYN